MSSDALLAEIHDHLVHLRRYPEFEVFTQLMKQRRGILRADLESLEHDAPQTQYVALNARIDEIAQIIDVPNDTRRELNRRKEQSLKKEQGE